MRLGSRSTRCSPIGICWDQSRALSSRLGGIDPTIPFGSGSRMTGTQRVPENRWSCWSCRGESENRDKVKGHSKSQASGAVMTRQCSWTLNYCSCWAARWRHFLGSIRHGKSLDERTVASKKQKRPSGRRTCGGGGPRSPYILDCLCCTANLRNCHPP